MSGPSNEKCSCQPSIPLNFLAFINSFLVLSSYILVWSIALAQFTLPTSCKSQFEPISCLVTQKICLQIINTLTKTFHDIILLALYLLLNLMQLFTNNLIERDRPCSAFKQSLLRSTKWTVTALGSLCTVHQQSNLGTWSTNCHKLIDGRLAHQRVNIVHRSSSIMSVIPKLYADVTCTVCGPVICLPPSLRLHSPTLA